MLSEKVRARAHGNIVCSGLLWPLSSTITMDEVQESYEKSPPSESNKGVKRKSDFQTVYCSICKVYLNSSSQATAHYTGKSHLNKVRNQSTEVSVMSVGLGGGLRKFIGR